ncbi:uncharacterized protein K460DRAFT_105477 [Cucurbitaria berberidis CBS 394.84]|uniref:DUF218 domain-containing protein n=1 Tax=Cucurbitaria berberidis CBS 394.84 TaxID=1168544 RepID=A0A9P4GHD6_9PLEO|nr:uncharacterized protein K460DRAFT_105477 [Cucurbitaria berberidis CBS 394.84]KAF1845246.1 hypothetical protein K460DRAFT_105477 [Cucurbitaria berberidis CBS 394.84]
MAPATPATALPRSRFNASASTADPAHVTATIAPAEDAAHKNTKHDWQAAEDPDFEHPDHVIPPRSYDGIEHLIVVCCHAIFLPDAESSNFALHSPHYEPHWLLAPFQKSDPETRKPGEHETFLAHVKAGLDALTIGTDPEHPPSSLLVLSGGATKPSHTPISEARSYYHAALAEELVQGHHHGGRAHRMFSKGYVLLEEQATDSFQNLLFSILLFRKTTGRYPTNIRIITHSFKAKRFLDLHAPTIRWPKDRVQVQGIDPVMSSTDLESTLRGEEQNGYAQWKKDPLGTGELLSGKRRQRAWDESVAGELVEGLEASVEELLQGSIPTELPWEQPTTKTT